MIKKAHKHRKDRLYTGSGTGKSLAGTGQVKYRDGLKYCDPKPAKMTVLQNIRERGTSDPDKFLKAMANRAAITQAMAMDLSENPEDYDDMFDSIQDDTEQDNFGLSPHEVTPLIDELAEEGHDVTYLKDHENNGDIDSVDPGPGDPGPKEDITTVQDGKTDDKTVE